MELVYLCCHNISVGLLSALLCFLRWLKSNPSTNLSQPSLVLVFDAVWKLPEPQLFLNKLVDTILIPLFMKIDLVIPVPSL